MDLMHQFMHHTCYDSELASVPTLLFGTIDGSLGVVASLPPPVFEFCTKLQVRPLRSLLANTIHRNLRSPPLTLLSQSTIV